MSFKVLVNATTLTVGGGVQVGATFISEFVGRCDERELCGRIAVSEAVLENLPEGLWEDERLIVVSPSPARPVAGAGARRALRALERSFGPDVVYSIGSPSYVRFLAPEVARFTDPWVTHASPLARASLPWFRRIESELRTRYKLIWLAGVSRFETQTLTAKAGLQQRLKISGQRIRVISNAAAPIFAAAAEEQVEGGEDRFRILTVAAPYHHKDLLMIPKIAAYFRSVGVMDRFSFTVTLPTAGGVVKQFWALATKLGVRDMIENAGRVLVEECVRLYREADVVFLPSLLETFSVTYLEAMHLGRPIVTTDLGFAHEICGDAAIYFEPGVVESAAAAINSLAHDADLRKCLVAKGRQRLQRFPSADERADEVIEWLRDGAG